ncbi:MAG: hypothetical protein ACYCY2_09500 [Acidithiobacillus ferriphilus]|uniref:hypothetical protein n=1 Tax=Acidithiobacillus sp. TaxID=1872118 RepID=UPI00230EF38D|nr:hypothetical protein [Acidithiobacillus sp.]MDA8247352.1 hypothetical protein [Acidithiobacillus sp.]
MPKRRKRAKYGQAEQRDGVSIWVMVIPCEEKDPHATRIRLVTAVTKVCGVDLLWGKRPFRGDPLHPHHGTLTA